MLILTESDLAQTIESFSLLAQNLLDSDLDRPWAWKGYNEGARFIFFRVYEEIRALQARLAAQRRAAGPALTAAQDLLANHHQAYWALQAVLLPGSPRLLDLQPSAGEWTPRQTLRHLINAEFSFFEAIRANLQIHHHGQDPSLNQVQEILETSRAQVEPQHQQAFALSLDSILALYSDIHYHGIESLAGLSDAQLALPTFDWEEEAFPLEFRLVRLDAHLRQHTIQLQKTLTAHNARPTEAQRLLAHIFSAVAGLESTLLGAPGLNPIALEEAAGQISFYTEALAQVLAE